MFVIADDIEARGTSRFEWLLHAPQGSLALAGEGAFEVTRPGVRLRGVLLRPDPHPLASSPGSRGPQGFDPTSCLAVEMTGESARPLVVLSVLREGEAPPRVRLDGQRLDIRKGDVEWTVDVVDRPAALNSPLLVVQRRRPAAR